MKIELRERTADHVRIYFQKASDPQIRELLPQSAQTVEEALEDYARSVSPGSASYGRTIYADDTYVGDIWCYCIHEDAEPDAMRSYCVFEKSYWNRGIATRALKLFLEEITEKFALSSIGAFTYSYNLPSLKVLAKSGFRVVEEFLEDGVPSCYLQKG